MRICPTCQAPYKVWSPGKFMKAHHPEVPTQVEVPACNCLRDSHERDYQAHLLSEKKLRAVERFQRMPFEDTVLPEDGVVVPHEGWAKTPSSMVASGAKFILYGPAGTGKTVIIKTMALDLCHLGFKVRGGYMRYVFDRLKDMDHVAEYMGFLLSGDVFVLDDVGGAVRTAYEADRLLSIVNYYNTPGRSILATMNFDLATLQIKLGSLGGDESAKQNAAATVSRLSAEAIVIRQADDTPNRRAVSETHRV